MKKIVFLILFVSAVFVSHSQDYTDTTKYIIYSDTMNITWNDFRGEISTDFARTYSEVSMQAVMNECELTYEIMSVMVKDRSRQLKDHQEKELLVHEITHFKITEVYTRKMRKEIDSLTALPLEKVKEQVSAIFRKYLKEAKEFQNKYDDETQHSVIREKQIEWEKRVDEMLEELKAYSDTHVTVPLKCKKRKNQ